MPNTLLVDHHARSLDGFGPRLMEAIQTLFPDPSGDHLQRLDACTLGDAVWKHMADRPSWVRPLSLEVTTSTGSNYRTIADLPWLCDDSARDELERVQGSSLRNIELGAHDGLFVGRPLVSLGQWLPACGVHAVFRVRPDGEATRVTVVPDAGIPIYLDRELNGRKVTVTAGRARGRFSLDELTGPVDELPSSRSLRRFRQLFSLEHTTTPSAWFSTSSATQIEDETGIPLVGGSLIPAHADWVVAQLSAPEAPPFGETWMAATNLRMIGDVYIDVIWLAIRSAILRTRNLSSDDTEARLLLDGIRRQSDGEIHKVLFGSGATMPLAIGEDTTNTLARVESRRKFTRFGPRGSSRPQRGLLPQRDLPPDFRGVLCPISTPESEDIGLIRFLATGARMQDPSTIAGSDKPAGPASEEDLSGAGGLVPFINHNDPVRASIGSRILRQAVVLEHPEPPLVRTGSERTVAETMGVCRSLARGRVESVAGDSVTVVDSSGRQLTHPFGPARTKGEDIANRWQVLIDVNDRVRKGDILAHAPDVTVDGGIAQLALGINCVVAYMPWHGLNYEDAIVVSASLAERFASFDEVVVRENLGEFDILTWAKRERSGVEAGETIAAILRDEHTRNVVSPVSGAVTNISETADYLEIRLLVRRPLDVGDKLTNRHGAKGVVSVVVPDADMPSLENGTPVELIVNPLGVLRRLNIGQFLETHVGLLSLLTGEEPEPTGRRLANLDLLRSRLADAGAPNGQLPLTGHDLSARARKGVTVGIQYFVKLNHMAVDKGQVRSGGRRSVRSHQPMPGSRWVGGMKTGGPQRMGEMEFWSLQAIGAAAMVDDVLVRRSDREPGAMPAGIGSTLLSVTAHLMAAGIVPVFETQEETRIRGGSDEFDRLNRSSVRRQWVELLDGDSLEKLIPMPPISEVRASEHPLYDDRHGGFGISATCPCGDETRPGRFCGTCREAATSRPERDRGRVRLGIPLCEPVPHPWFDAISEHPGTATIQLLPILPPAYRTFGRDPLDRRYFRVVATNTRLQDALNTGFGERQAREALARAIEDILGRRGDDPDRQTIAARLGGKTGLLRRYLLGRTTDMSGRGVIVPDPTLDPEHVGLPEWMYDELGLAQPTSTAAFDDVCVLNRQPSLHPYNLVALRARPVHGDAIRIHPLLCGAIAGDFDGDTVAIHHPASQDARQQAWETLRPSLRLRSSASGQLLPNMDLDIALGLYLTTQTSLGRDKLAAQIGVAVPDVPLAGTTLTAVADTCADPAEEPRVQLERLQKLMAAGFEAASGWSISLLETAPLQPEMLASLDGDTLQAEVTDRVARSESLTQAVAAGVAGKPQVLIQLLGDRVPSMGFDSTLPHEPTDAGNLLSGLSDDRYFACVNGALRSLADKKLTTPYAGALTKALVEAAYDVLVSEEDCEWKGLRSPLTCRNAEPCVRCYGPDPATGRSMPVGFPVGILAAQLVGERSTQLAMKAFHGGGTGVAVGGRVSQLYGLFGHGRFQYGEDRWERLADIFGTARDLDQVGPHLLEIFTQLIDGEVLPIHAAVILRRLWEVYRSTGRVSILTEAAVTGGSLVDAATRGNLGVIIRDVDSDERPSVATAKLTLIMGGGGR